jgi:hypothetical protein
LPTTVNTVNADAREPKTQTQRFVYARWDTEDGPLEIIPPEEFMWYKFYVCNFYITQDTKLAKAFRNRFCHPYPQFLQLVEDIRSKDLFDRWCGYKSNNKKVSPVELLMLGLLRYLSRGWTFDDCEESTAIDQDVHRSFFRVFIKFGGSNTCQFARGFVEHEGVQRGWVPWLCWVIRLYSHCHRQM